MSRKANPTVIGGFVLGGVLLAVTAVVVFGSGRLFRDTSPFISFFEGSVAGLNIGAPVKFRGIEVGEVTAVLLDLPGLGRPGVDVRMIVIYELDREQVERMGGSARLDDPFALDTLLALGIRAELATESLVTGQKYIALDLDPENPVESEPVPGAPHPEIPTVNSGLARIEEEIYGIIAELGAVQLDALVNSATDAFSEIAALAATPQLSEAIEELPATISHLNETVSDLQAFLANVDSSLAPIREGFLATTERATSTMDQLETTLRDVGVVLQDVGSVLQPQSPLFVRFERAMVDLSAASRALRTLADYLERNPSALLRGRPGGGR